MVERKKRNNRAEFLYNIFVIIVLATIFALVHTCDKQKPIGKPTKLVVKNESDKDTVLVYLTLGVQKGYSSNVNGIFGIENAKKNSQGSFYLSPKDSVIYDDKSYTPIQGNISFFTPPSNCSNVNLFEFCLNNKATAKNAQETVDISCVGGVNVIGKITLSGKPWTDNYRNNDVEIIENRKKYSNQNISGVYPYGCSYCTSNAGKPDCIGDPSAPNAENICQIQRSSNDGKGAVTISYLKKIKN